MRRIENLPSKKKMAKINCKQQKPNEKVVNFNERKMKENIEWRTKSLYSMAVKKASTKIKTWLMVNRNTYLCYSSFTLYISILYICCVSRGLSDYFFFCVLQIHFVVYLHLYLSKNLLNE